MATSLLGKHFILFPVEVLQEMYKHRHIVVHIVSVDFKQPYMSVIVLERKECEDA